MNKRGQISETITWTVASVIIVITLLVSIFVFSAMSGSSFFGRQVSLNERNNLFLINTLAGYLLNSNNGISCYSQIGSDGNLIDAFCSNKAVEVFSKALNKKIGDNVRFSVEGKRNNYFPIIVSSVGKSASNSVIFSEWIKLNGMLEAQLQAVK